MTAGDGGFVRTHDRPGLPDGDDVRRLAVYPDSVQPLLGENQNEADDDIIAAFDYPWYANPATSGAWSHWEGGGHNPPLAWSANYTPDFPDSAWDPAVMLYDSTDVGLLRWQDQAMAQAGLDIAIGSWWGIGHFTDAAFASAIRFCKSVQWCIYYEMEAYADPSVVQIVGDLQWVIDRLGPTRNYATVDGKWLVFVYVASDEDAASWWRQAKQQLRDEGYELYINAVGNVEGAGNNTYCPACNTLLVERAGLALVRSTLLRSGACPKCAKVVPGIAWDWASKLRGDNT